MVACAVDGNDDDLGSVEAESSSDVGADSDAVETSASPDYPGCTIEFAYPSSGAGKVYARTTVRCTTARDVYVKASLYKNGLGACWDESYCFSTSCSAYCGATNPAGNQTWCSLNEAQIDGGSFVDGKRCRPLSWDPN